MRLAAAFVILAVFTAGCIGQGPSESADELFIKYAELSAAVDNYIINYDTSYEIDSQGESLNLEGVMTINKQMDNSYVFYRFQDPTTLRNVETHIYKIGSTVYSCAWETGSIQKNCIQTDDVPSDLAPDPVQEREQVSALLEGGVVSLKSEGRRSVAGYACDSIVIDYDLEKLKNQAPSAFIGTEITFMQQRQCYELESGVPLIMSVAISLLDNNNPGIFARNSRDHTAERH